MLLVSEHHVSLFRIDNSSRKACQSINILTHLASDFFSSKQFDLNYQINSRQDVNHNFQKILFCYWTDYFNEINHALCTFYYYPRFSDHQHGRDWVQNCPLGQPSLGKWGFFLDLFVLGPRARLKLGVIRSLLETLTAVQSSSNLGKRTFFIFPTIKHNIRFQNYLVRFLLC